MPEFKLSDGTTLHYRVDDYTDPWRRPETILMIHGNAERSDSWYGWVPHLARHYRVIRPDTRGYGASGKVPKDFPWSVDVPVRDFVELMKGLGITRYHLVGAKLGGTIARHYAALHPDAIATLTVAGTPPPRWEEVIDRSSAWREQFLQDGGVEKWARKTMSGRLGSAFPPEALEWWTVMMAKTAQETMYGFSGVLPSTDISADLPKIKCPTLVITTEGSALGSVEKTRSWQKMIPDSRLLVLPGDSYHVAASDPDKCAMATLDFIREVSGAKA